MRVLLRLLTLVVVLVCLSREGQATIYISEILADPSSGINGDANNDGVVSSSQDEFIELFNDGASSIDIAGWILKDALSTRHIFPNLTILNPNQHLVVFGGGSPSLPGILWQTASSGQLSLNNTAETVTLLDINDQMIDQVIYGSMANQDQSIIKIDNSWILHSSLLEAEARIFSPGAPPPNAPNTASIPEPSSLGLMASGFLFFRNLVKRQEF